MDIIQYAVVKISEMMVENLDLTQKKELPFHDLISNVQESMNQIGIALVEDFIGNLDDSLKQHPVRKQTWHIQRKNDEKVISTTMGDIILNRTYYKNKLSGKYTYLVDDHLELTPHSRMDLGLEAEILNRVKDQSYQKTIDSFKTISIRSRTAVMNVVHKHVLEPSEVAIATQKKVMDVLYIEADEDHVAYQDGKNRFMKLVYVYEGRKKTTGSTKRIELEGKRYFTGLYPDNEALWFSVLDYLDEAYDLEKVKHIYLSGDGAPWIKSGANIIPNSTFILDSFHLIKYIKKACVAHQEWFSILYGWILNGQKELLHLFYQTRLDDELKDSERIALVESKRYIFRHWTAIQNQKNPDYFGCSAEGHVSHVLSARLSSRPLGWSLTGAEHIAKLRAYDLNGGNIKEGLEKERKEFAYQTTIEKLDRRVNRKYSQQFQNVTGNLPALSKSKKTQLSIVLKGLRGK